MPRPFASHYDQLYADKDYGQDVETVLRLIAPRAMADLDVLEIGAGTGNHTRELLKLAKSVCSVEIDADFADVFEEKFRDVAPGCLHFERRPVAEIERRDFNVSVALFHVLNYLDPTGLEAFCSAIATRLQPGGCFVADTWNGAAALLDPPRSEVRRKTLDGKQIVQRVDPAFRTADRSLTLDYTIEISDEHERTVFSEQLQLYLWTAEELEGALRRAGFSNVRFWDYRRFPEPARADSWRLWLKAE
jgi:SAM-dependent methyltransferase